MNVSVDGKEGCRGMMTQRNTIWLVYLVGAPKQHAP